MLNLMRWDPMQLHRLFARPEAQGGLTTSDWAPLVDVQETQEEYLVKAELPGVPKENVKVTLEDGTLCLKGERTQEKEEKGKRYHRIERMYGTFLRRFTLPEDVEPSKVRATYEQGVLTVHMPKGAVAPAKAVEVDIH